MRLLIAVVLAFASGCCDFAIFPEDECTSDSDCPDDDDRFCNGIGVCTGFFGAQCGIQVPDCFDGYCDSDSDSCEPCTSADDAPECRWLFPESDGGPDAGPDAGRSFCGTGSSGEVIGSPCDVAGTCGAGLECVPSVVAAVGPIERALAQLCSPACDPSAVETGCEPCAATCIDSVRVGGARVPVLDLGRPPFCAVHCEPSQTSTGCARPGFSCDLVSGTCQDACTSDQECRLVRDESGALVEDATRAHTCNDITGRCRSAGTLGARIGDSCSVDADCTTDGVCLRGDGWPDTGYCTRFECQWPETACGEAEQCHHRAFERPACLLACTVGAEPESDRLGPGGHGAGCAPGLSCRWDGRSGNVSPNGGCVPGNYNDVITPNLGAACTRDEECHSPFGLGRCAFSDGGMGICALIDCADADPGISCGEGASCARLGDDALCLRSCTMASECAAGHACAPSPSGPLVCAPSCTADADCRAGERCGGTECAFGGACRCVAP